MKRKYKRRKPTLTAIAQIVGKSHVQVFRVLTKKKGHYSKDTERRVYEAIEQLKAQDYSKSRVSH